MASGTVFQGTARPWYVVADYFTLTPETTDIPGRFATNRLNVSTRQVAGEWVKSVDARAWMESHSA